VEEPDLSHLSNSISILVAIEYWHQIAGRKAAALLSAGFNESQKYTALGDFYLFPLE